MRTSRLIIVAIFLTAVFSCRKEIQIELPEYEPKLVVEGSIETNLPPVIILTKSVGYFDPISPETFANMFVKGAIVKVSDGSKEVQLTEYCMSDLTQEQIDAISMATGMPPEELTGLNYCVYTLGLGGILLGKEQTTYKLTIEHEGKKWFSSTTIPKSVSLDSLWFKPVTKSEDSLGYVWARLSDPAGEYNYYRWYSMRINSYQNGELAGQQKDTRFLPPNRSAFDDKFSDGLTFDFYYYRPSEPNRTKPDDYAPYSRYFIKGDTVVIKFSSINKESYDFLRVLEDQIRSENSPFASPSTIPSNIKGDAALGAWIGYAPSLDTVICK